MAAYTPPVSAGISNSNPANDIQSFYNAITYAIETTSTSRYRLPDVIVIHPRRYAWLCSLSDTNARPLIPPHAGNAAGGTIGQLTGVAPENRPAQIAGLAIVLDANISTSGGDHAYIFRSRDLALWEGTTRTRIASQTLAGQLTLIIQLWAYAAFAVRYPSSVAILGPMPSPTLGS